MGDDLVAALGGAGRDVLPEVVREINLNFTGSEAALADPYAFAANGDVSGQPPVLILNSEADELRASGECVRRRPRGGRRRRVASRWSRARSTAT